MDAPQFHSCYDSFPEPLLLQTAPGSWLSNPAADALCLTQTDFNQLSAWNGDASLWLAGQFFSVHGSRTPDGLFLILHADAFTSSSAIKLSDQLRQRVSAAFLGVNTLRQHLHDESGDWKADLSAVNRALYQLFRISTELDACAVGDLLSHKVCLDLTDWFRRLCGQLRHWCPAEHVVFHIDAPNDSLYTVADPDLLNELVAHLVSNAIKAVPGGRADIAISLKKQGNQAAITVCGAGDAFSPAVLTDPLWNQPVDLRPGHGLGLGLPIAQRIAALHSGTLMVTPTKDGSQVVFSFPLNVPDGYLASPASRIEPIGGYSRVRVILSDALPAEAFHPDYPPLDEI